MVRKVSYNVFVIITLISISLHCPRRNSSQYAHYRSTKGVQLEMTEPNEKTVNNTPSYPITRVRILLSPAPSPTNHRAGSQEY